MSNQKEVGPFPASVNPVHDGVYRRKLDSGIGVWSRWWQGRWRVQRDSYLSAAKEELTSAYQTKCFVWWGVEKS